MHRHLSARASSRSSITSTSGGAKLDKSDKLLPSSACIGIREPTNCSPVTT